MKMKFKSILAAVGLTLSFTSQAQLSGSYKIGDGELFPAVNDAIDSLNSAGVSGPVIFNIKAGSYFVEASISDIVGSSEINTVEFKSLDNQAESVKLNHNATMVSKNYVIKLDGANHVKFSNLSFVSESNQLGNLLVTKIHL